MILGVNCSVEVGSHRAPCELVAAAAQPRAATTLTLAHGLVLLAKALFFCVFHGLAHNMATNQR